MNVSLALSKRTANIFYTASGWLLQDLVVLFVEEPGDVYFLLFYSSNVGAKCEYACVLLFKWNYLEKVSAKARLHAYLLGLC